MTIGWRCVAATRSLVLCQPAALSDAGIFSVEQKMGMQVSISTAPPDGPTFGTIHNCSCGRPVPLSE
jgi:hypothetical protein